MGRPNLTALLYAALIDLVKQVQDFGVADQFNFDQAERALDLAERALDFPDDKGATRPTK